MDKTYCCRGYRFEVDAASYETDVEFTGVANFDVTSMLNRGLCLHSEISYNKPRP